jgi:predicted peroxiredoxin
MCCGTMRALNMIVATPDAERFRGAILLAAAQAALGGAATLFLQLDAVVLLRAPITAPRDEAHGASGLPSLAMLLADATALGVRIIACQSGMALCGLSADDLPDGVLAGGPVGLLQQAGPEDQLLFV